MDSDLYSTPIAAALMYGPAMGWRVAPLSPGSKVPVISQWSQIAATDEASIRDWWSGHPGYGVCIVTGRETGLWVLDVDVSDGKQGMETLVALLKKNGGGGLGNTVVARTPSGGYHYYFTYPEDCEVHNSASNRLGPGLDVRGEGGQVNAPPTTRGDSCYRWAEGREPWNADVLPAPAWLLELVRDVVPVTATYEPIRAAAAVMKQSLSMDGVPEWVTRYNGEHSWATLLDADGWSYNGRDNNETEVVYWTRPGKDTRSGISASTNYAGSDLLYVWSTSVEGLDSDRAYDKYGYMVRRDFGGDFKAAADHFVGVERSRQLVNGSPPNIATPPANALREQKSRPDETQSRIQQLEMPTWLAG